MKQQIHELFLKYKDENIWGGSEDHDGTLHPAEIDFDMFETELLEILRKHKK